MSLSYLQFVLFHFHLFDGILRSRSNLYSCIFPLVSICQELTEMVCMVHPTCAVI